MNSIQAKILGGLLFLAGLAALCYGGYELWLAWDHNSALAETDKAVGGLLTSVTKALGSDPTMSYQPGSVFAGVGFGVALVGWLVLGKVK